MSASPVVKTGEEAKYHLIQKNISKVGLGELALAGATTGAMLVNGYVAIPLIISGVRRPLIIQWGVGQFGGSLG
ncbi:TPA: hypothetical protein ACQZGT_004299, partial [Escherichia coli]